MGSTVVARKIRKSFATGRRGRRRVTEVLKGVDLSVEAGEMVSIVGPSGSGKSTLLYCLSGLEAADEGSIEVMGRQVVHARRSVLAKIRSGHVGFVFQSYNLIPSLSVGDNVSLPARLAGRPMSARQTRAALESVGLAGRERDRPGDLSGGEQQRVAIARALVNSPAVLLADEPSGNLDSHNRDEIHRLFFELRDRLGQTVVIVTHDEHLAAMADRKITMSDGRIL